MNDQTPLPAPGWYADPASPETTLRYWDGADWTEHVHPLEPQATGGAASPEAGTAQEPQVTAAPLAESAPTEPAPDVAVPSAEGVAPSRFDAAEAAEEPVAEAAAAQDQDGDAPAQAAPAEPTPSPAPSAAEEPAAGPTVPDSAAPAAAPQAERPNPYAAQQPHGQQPNPYAPTAAAPHPGQGAPQPPTAPWAQGAANPYQQPQPAQYGAQPGAPKSNKGLWIGLGIGGGVFVLLVIGIIVAVAVFFANIGNTIRDFDPPVAPSFGAEEPPGTEAPEIEGEVYAMGEAFVVPDPFGSDGSGWELTVTDFSAEAAEAVSAAPGNKGFAVLVQATNLGTEAADPYFGLTPTFIGSDGLEYIDGEQIAPSLYDVDSIDAGATTQFTFT
ncbi:MAG: DUF2510 domain-containing protein, partial [Microbacteriaceae bacterium]